MQGFEENKHREIEKGYTCMMIYGLMHCLIMNGRLIRIT